MNRRRLRAFAWAAAAAAVTLAAAAASFAEDLTVDGILAEMSKKAETIKDLKASCKVTKYDSVFEEKRESRLDLFYRKPDLARVDSYRKRDGKEVLSKQVIIGKDFVLRIWPENRTAERRKMSEEEMKRRREDRNDPLTFFSRPPEDIKKDFNVEMLGQPKDGKVELRITPRAGNVRFDYKSIGMTVDTKTWLPVSIKAMTGGDEEDWSLYEFRDIAVNPGLKDSVFEAPAGIKVEEVTEMKEDGKEN
jgi:outer membrane lipoprotein-sorting protein